MSQTIWDSIDPAATSGNQLATLLNDFKNAVVSGFSGPGTRPANLQAYGYWVDTTNVGSGILSYKFYDGTNDIEVFQINTTSQGVILTGSEDIFGITKTGEDSVGSILDLIKKRDLNNGQVLINDEIGKINFTGTDDTGVERIQAQLIAVSTDDVTSAEQGSYLSFLVTNTDTNALVEALRVSPDGRLGVGTSSPGATFEARGTTDSSGVKSTRVQDTTSPSVVIAKKQRSTGLGQTLSGDELGEFVAKSTDQNGAEIDVFKVTSYATQNHTDAAQGTGFRIQAKNNDTTTYSTVIDYNNGNLTINGQAENDLEETIALQDDQATRELLQVSGAAYGGFIAEILLQGRDGSETRKQKIVIDAIYDANTTTWDYDVENKIIKGTEFVATLDVPATNVENLVINYVNQFSFGSFISGRVMKKVRRYSL